MTSGAQRSDVPVGDTRNNRPSADDRGSHAVARGPHQDYCDGHGEVHRSATPWEKELQERVLAEANRLYDTKTSLPTAIDRLIELADGNSNAFGIGGSNYRKMIQTPEGEAATRRMLGAEMKRTRGFTVPADSWWPGGN